MTRLPIDSWNVAPRLDLPAYALNEACPVTGETDGLEDHHIFRRSFTALGKEDNQRLYWVETEDGSLLKNRVNLSPRAHERITTNRARLEYRDGELFYVEGDEDLNLDLRLRLMAPSEKITKRRRKKAASTPEERKARVNHCIRTPAGEENVLPELEDALRERLRKDFPDWSEDVPGYYVWAATAAAVLQS